VAEKNKMPKVVIVEGDDWKGLYVDGKLEYEDHNITPKKVLDVLGIELGIMECDLNWLFERGDMPKNLSEVKVKRRR